jgi:hypothetical protein
MAPRQVVTSAPAALANWHNVVDRQVAHGDRVCHVDHVRHVPPDSIYMMDMRVAVRCYGNIAVFRMRQLLQWAGSELPGLLLASWVHGPAADERIMTTQVTTIVCNGNKLGNGSFLAA